MGNSPSRNELHGDHMSSIANNSSSGQETFQSHSYPNTKFTAVAGIHNENFQGTIVSASARQSATRQEFNGAGGGTGTTGTSSTNNVSSPNNGGGTSNGATNKRGTPTSGGPNTPDLLYSMDSLNVCGNNGTSITSAELPPSSISPANCRDPWTPSSYSDESLHTQCRNLSRLHKDLHNRSTDDEGLSSSTYESDSLNPAATLSGMIQNQQKKPQLTRPYPHHQNTIKRQPSPPKPEVAEEAIELLKSEIAPNTTDLIPSSSSSSSNPPIDHSITINGRKVSTCEETPLPIPIVVGIQTDNDHQPNKGHHKTPKMGIKSSSSSEPNNKSSPPPPPLLLSSISSSSSISSNGISTNGTIKRGSRMKSPPPPPPPSKLQNNSNNNNSTLITDQTTQKPNEIQKTVEPQTQNSQVAPETCEKMSSLNSLMRRNISFASNTSNRKSSSFEILSEDEDNQLVITGNHDNDDVNVIQTQLQSDQNNPNQQENPSTSLCNDHNEKNKDEKTNPEPEDDQNYIATIKRKERNDKNNADDKPEAPLNSTKIHQEKIAADNDDDDESTDILIRPCELSKQSCNYNSSRNSSDHDDDDDQNKSVVCSVGVGMIVVDGVHLKEKMETVNEQNHDARNKTELDCKDDEQDGKVKTNDMSGIKNGSHGDGDGEGEEIKPVSSFCSSSNGYFNEMLILADKVEMKSNKILESCVDDDDDGDGKNTVGGGGGGDTVTTQSVEFLEMSEKMLEESCKSSGVMTNTLKKKNMMFDVFSTTVPLQVVEGEEREDVSRRCSNGIFESKFGTDDGERGEARTTTSRENTPPKQLQLQLQPSSSSSPPLPLAMVGVAVGEMDVVTSLKGSKSGKSSNASSRRGSLSSSSGSVELNVLNAGGGGGVSPSSNGILNCNRMSLCSLPDNEVDVDVGSFESPPPPMLDSETIRDQPLGWKSNGQMLTADVVLNEKEDEPLKNVDEIDGENLRKNRSGKSKNEFSHQRKASMSKIEFDWGEIKRSMASSAPSSGSTNLFEKRHVTRKASFPELYINTAAFVRPSVERKHSAGQNEKTHRHSDYNIPLSTGVITSFDSTNPFFCGNGDNDCTGTNKEGRRGKTSQFAKNNDNFLQTLGEIYACKSKLITSNNSSQQTPAPIPIPPVVLPVTSDPNLNASSCLKESVTATATTVDPVPTEKSKSADASIETVDGFESQDRSISEYNISPRSARELVTESLLNGNSSISSTTVSQISIVTINESDLGGGGGGTAIGANTTAPVPFSHGIETENHFVDGANITIKSVGGDNPDVVIPRVTPQSNSLTNGGGGSSATFRKKPSFAMKKSSKCGDSSMPSVEIFEPPSKTTSTKICNDNVEIKTHLIDVDDKPLNMPIAPPMPPLQYCRINNNNNNSSYPSSTASSSIGDSSGEIHDKSKPPPFFDEIPIKSCKPSSRTSPDRSIQKLNGNGSSECSLIELSLANQRSTSDAIIVELKKAQAKKLKFSEQLTEERNDKQGIDMEKSFCSDKPSQVAFVQVAESSVKISSRQEDFPGKVSDEKGGGSVVIGQHHQETISETNHVTDSNVKTIVNGKHTNSIIVNETPVVGVVKKDSVKRTRSGVHPTKSCVAQQRGNIMSPSLSGNYTEMNGIDSETMGASSIHEDELSGHLKQKENHINESHDNVDEVQTMNKLDGASFRRVLSEYEKTLSMFIQQIDQLKQRMDEAETEKQTLIKERDQALEDLRNVESAFSDVHRKYERAKALLENMKSNEDTLIRRDQEMMQRIQNRDKKIDMIKEKAQESIEKMHLDYETRIKEMEFENAKLRAQYRKMEMKLSTLENDVEQKAKENAQLSALCDELINGQVGQV